MKFLRMITTTFICSLVSPAFADQDNQSAINLSKYFAATCQDYTGTWQGFITDPSDLFGDGGPWPVTMKLYHRDNNVIGSSSAINYGKNASKIPSRQLWAQCQNGVLKNIFWGNKGTCGRVSEQGILISKNVLVLQLNYENAMNGTSFYTFLERKSNNYPDAIPTDPQDFAPGDIKSCH